MNGRLSPRTLRLNVPASPVNEDGESRGQRHLVSQELPLRAVVRVLPGDAPDNFCGGFRRGLFIAEDTGIHRSVVIIFREAAPHQAGIALGTGDEVEAGGVFGFLPEPEVQNGAVIGHDDAAALGGMAAQGVEVVTFEDVEVVFFAAGDGVAEIEVAHRLAAQIEQIDMVGGVAFVIGAARIMHRGGVKVAVSGGEIEGGEFRKSGKGIGE